MSWKELLQDLVQTGPDNVKKLVQLAEKLPSDATLQKLDGTLNKLIPYIPRLERILGDGNVKNLERLVSQLPDKSTLDRLAKALPMLEKMPDKETLTKLLDKADSLKGFLDSLEGSPT